MRLRNFSVLFLPLTKAWIDFDVYWIQTDRRGKYIYAIPPRGGGGIALTMYWNNTEIMFEKIEKFHAYCLSYLCSLKLSQVIDKLFLSVESIHYTDQ